MRLPAYLILAYLAIGLQLGLGEPLRVGNCRPDLVLLAVIFIAIHAPRDAALLGCFGIGAIQDLVTLNSLGVCALAYSLVGMFTVSTQELIYRAHPVTHFSLGFVGSLLAAVVVLVHGWIRGPSASVTQLLGNALYTACAAPVVLGLLNLARKPFSFQSRRRGRAY
ncbi:MAG TPA: rod shape-determining protein MreD [Tepidisphaeraceae bacterium]|nr:rod shape-determining protein MreD [Tepidisphaeraceae bacterium]